MRELHVDIETYSPVDLKKRGVFLYTAHPEFEVILFQYRYGDWADGDVRVVDVLSGEKVPDGVLQDLTDPTVRKHAWNASFERTALAAWLLVDMPPEQWYCEMVAAATLGLPLDLDRASKVLKIKRPKKSGMHLIRYFCVPCKPTQTNGGRTRNLPHHDPVRWAEFKDYGRFDVLAECEIASRTSKYPLLPIEHQTWCLDQRVNDGGSKVDVVLAQQAVVLDAAFKARCFDEAKRVTGLTNPNSVAQLKGWLEQADDIKVESLNKKIVPKLLAATSEPVVRRALELRQELSKTSVNKYKAAVARTSDDGFLRGGEQFYGANRTGRWAGRGVQKQNLPSNVLQNLLLARQLVREGAFEELESLFGSPAYVLQQLLRTMFIPDSADEVLLSVDFKAIEARKLAWGAREQWRLEVFKTHGQIYEASASAMFHVPWSEFQDFIDRKKKHPLRQKGKVAELALGYQGGEGALITMGALDMGLKLEELDPIKVAWRAANLRIAGQSYRGEEPGFWERMDTAAIQCVRTKRPQPVPEVQGTEFTFEHGILFMRLPSGRRLAYPQAKLGEGKFGNVCVKYNGLDDNNNWGTIDSYGGKWVENWCQASSRDVLRDKILAIDRIPRYHSRLRFTVHDEGIWSVPRSLAKPEELEEIFAEPLPWAPGLPLAGDGDVLEFYMKPED